MTHLLYVDNIIIFCEANVEQLMYLNWILMWFKAISSLKVNMEKSELIPMGSIDNLDKLVVVSSLYLFRSPVGNLFQVNCCVGKGR